MNNENYANLSEKEIEELQSLHLLNIYLEESLIKGDKSFSIPLITFDGIFSYKEHILKFESTNKHSITHTIDYVERVVKFRIDS
ncbi:hypothetical protein LQZ24_05660 [Fructobacillus sp. M1-13]|uniref:Uncharacterized protein n=1 Tax=Fructobacillus papyriferae TaxID=2713171 RepID=A0ABS5QPE6_9LACO|nr:hypothetical protein [Fructobacillus papyriferae]MBS9335033.1 hypothetical protein [Fructobacillus papyriferae]MCD2159481.1 hypothetical protein [Fructobacillus papyriferae]